MERVVKKQLMIYIEENSLLPENQFGFRAKQRINHLHLFLHNKITSTLNKKQIFKLCLLDYSKAFDVVNFKILLKKLIMHTKGYFSLGQIRPLDHVYQ